MRFMTHRKIKILALILGLSAGATALYYYGPQRTQQTPDSIIPFQDDRDTTEILDIFEKDRYWLVSSEDYSPEFMLKNRAPNKHDSRYFGKLIIKVLRENDQFIGFTAYYMKNFCTGILLFVAVKPELRGKGYAQQLMKHAINDLKRQGASIITLVTRTTNESAQKLYKRLGFTVSYEEDGYVYFELHP